MAAKTTLFNFPKFSAIGKPYEYEPKRKTKEKPKLSFRQKLLFKLFNVDTSKFTEPEEESEEDQLEEEEDC